MKYFTKNRFQLLHKDWPISWLFKIFWKQLSEANIKVLRRTILASLRPAVKKTWIDNLFIVFPGRIGNDKSWKSRQIQNFWWFITINQGNSVSWFTNQKLHSSAFKINKSKKQIFIEIFFKSFFCFKSSDLLSFIERVIGAIFYSSKFDFELMCDTNAKQTCFKNISSLFYFVLNRRRLVKLVPGQKLELAQARFESPVSEKHTGRKAEPLLGFLFRAGHKLNASLIGAKFSNLASSRDFFEIRKSENWKLPSVSLTRGRVSSSVAKSSSSRSRRKCVGGGVDARVTQNEEKKRKDDIATRPAKEALDTTLCWHSHVLHSLPVLAAGGA